MININLEVRFELEVTGSREQVSYHFRRLGRAGGRQRRAHARRSQLLAWLISLIELLNCMFLSRISPAEDDKHILHVRKRSTNLIYFRNAYGCRQYYPRGSTNFTVGRIRCSPGSAGITV